MDQDEPMTYQEAIIGPESEKWLEAVKINGFYVHKPGLDLGRTSYRS